MATSELSDTALTFADASGSGNLSFVDNQFSGSKTACLSGVKTSYLKIGNDEEIPEFGEVSVKIQKFKSGDYTFDLKAQAETESYDLIIPKPTTSDTYLRNDGQGNLSWSIPATPNGYNKIWNFGTVMTSWSSADNVDPTSFQLSSTHASWLPFFRSDAQVGGRRLVLQDATQSSNQSVVSFDASDYSDTCYWELQVSVSFTGIVPVGESFIIYGNDTLSSVSTGGDVTGADQTTGVAVEIDFKGTLDSARYGINVYEGGVLSKSYWYGSDFLADSPFRMMKLRREGGKLRFEVSNQSDQYSQSHRNVIEYTLQSSTTPVGSVFGCSSWTLSGSKHSCEISSLELRGLVQGSDNI